MIKLFYKKSSQKFILILVVLMIFLSNPTITFAQVENYVEVQTGDMPVLLAIGHAGWKSVGSLTNTGYSADPVLRELVTLLREKIYQKTNQLMKPTD